jgi:cysteine synthase A
LAELCSSILDAVGRTPLIELRRLPGSEDARIIVKAEFLNPGGSIKTRSALAMIEAAERAGILKPGSIIVEPTSGNQGIGLAMVGAVKGYSVKVVMPDSVSMERKKLLENYGAEVILIEDRGNIGEVIEQCVQKALDMARADSRVFIPQQFENPNNPQMHRATTAREILEQYRGAIDAFCSGIGTGGTLTGIGEVLKEAFPGIIITAVEPEKAAILSGGPIGSHLQQGIGDGLIPPVLNRSIIDEIITVSDEQALATARRLAREEGLMVGISSGTNVWAALKLAQRLGKGKTVLTVLPDTGERYISTPLFR